MDFSRHKLAGVLLTLILMSFGCRQAKADPPAPTPGVRPAQPTAFAPQSRSAERTTLQDVTPTLRPTSTPHPPTATPAPPMPTPVPTIDIQDWHEAFTYQRNGDYDRAIRGYQTLLAGQPSDADLQTIRFHLGETYLLNDDSTLAEAVLSAYTADYPDDATAWFLLGRAREPLEHWAGAVDAFQAYRKLDDTLADYAGLRIAAALENLDRSDEAADAYATVAQVTPDGDVASKALEGLAEIALAANDPAGAGERYAQAAAKASDQSEKARLLGLAGTSYLAGGKLSDATATLQQVVNEYVATGSAYMALGELLLLEESVNERVQGLVYYYNGDYRAAVDVLTRYLVSEPAPLGDSLYFLGRSYEGLGRWTAAINAYDQLIANYPGNDRYGATWVRKARAERRLGNTDAAISKFRKFADEHPSDPLADNALWEAARALEGLDQDNEAAELYRIIVVRYPQGDMAAEASFRIGILPYLNGDYAAAREAWQLAARQAKFAEVRARALLWAGKAALALDDAEGAAADLATAARIAPLNFDGLRAQILLDDAVPQSSAQLSQNRPSLSAWLGLSEVTLADIDGRLQSDARYRRGEALLAVGLRDAGLAELKALRDAYWELPAHLARLAALLDDSNSRAPSIASAERALILTGTSPLEAPAELARLAYPVDYADLVIGASERYGLDPRLMAALIRQESRFDRTATSYANARGLTQVIPSTGWYIAGKLGTQDFDVDSLYRPYRSIEFGAWYLDEQMERFGDEILALAAYNGGPGNGRRWQALTDDVDMLVASIHLDQTRIYVREVVQQYTVYQALYDEQLSPR